METYKNACTLLCLSGRLPGERLSRDCRRKWKQETDPARYDFMCRVKPRWGKRSFKSARVSESPHSWWHLPNAAGEGSSLCAFTVKSEWISAVCSVGGDTVVPSPRSAAPVQLRHTGGPVECWLHLCRNVQEKVRSWKVQILAPCLKLKT